MNTWNKFSTVAISAIMGAVVTLSVLNLWKCPFAGADIGLVREIQRLEETLGITTNKPSNTTNMKQALERLKAATSKAQELKTAHDDGIVERDRLKARIAELEASNDPSVAAERDRLKAELAEIVAELAELETALGIPPEVDGGVDPPIEVPARDGNGEVLPSGARTGRGPSAGSNR